MRVCQKVHSQRTERAGRWVEHFVAQNARNIANHNAEAERDREMNGEHWKRKIHLWATSATCRQDAEDWLDNRPEIVDSSLSQAAIERLFEMEEAHVPHERPSWDDTILQMAYTISKRSPDTQTACGAIIVDERKHILSVGYNGWMPNIDDDLIPNVRAEDLDGPCKHDWVIHAEENAILNCEHRPCGATLYCTNKPCLPCIFRCVAAGISEVVYINGSTTTNTDGRDVDWEIAVWLAREQIRVRGVDFTPNE